MTSSLCVLQRILHELQILNKRIAVRTNAIGVYTFDTSITAKQNFNIEKIFSVPKGIIATQLTIIELGGGFSINVNNSGKLDAIYGYVIENEEINDVELIGSGVAGTAKIRIGATI